jgi:predicted glycoside hydrolase/deacetylase ChbG (UPF0249 family)
VRARLPAALLLLAAASPSPAEPAPDAGGAIRLLVRADDLATSHAANEACLKSFTEGVARSVEVVVPGPWYPEAVALLKGNPGYDAGVHLCLTSEWEKVKWRPLTAVPGLADARGFFFPAVRQRKDFPPNTALLDAKPKAEDVERELRAQIERAKADIPQLSHLSDHMGAAQSTPEFKAIVQKLAAEYGLPAEAKGAKHWNGFDGPRGTPEEKEATFAANLEKLGPGTWMLVEHPGMDVPEMRAQGHLGYETVAIDREGVTRAFTSPKVLAVAKARGIRLVSYAEVNR